MLAPLITSRAGSTISDSRGLKVIARFRDGRLLKGISMNFRHEGSYFHIEEPDKPYGEGTRVDLKDLKAVFFVKSFEGKPGYEERSVFDQAPSNGRPVRVSFSDGEQITGMLQHAIDPKESGFFLYPADAESNNDHIFALREAVSKVEYLAAGTAGAELASSSGIRVEPA